MRDAFRNSLPVALFINLSLLGVKGSPQCPADTEGMYEETHSRVKQLRQGEQVKKRSLLQADNSKGRRKGRTNSIIAHSILIKNFVSRKLPVSLRLPQ